MDMLIGLTAVCVVAFMYFTPGSKANSTDCSA